MKILVIRPISPTVIKYCIKNTQKCWGFPRDPQEIYRPVSKTPTNINSLSSLKKYRNSTKTKKTAMIQRRKRFKYELQIITS